MARSRASLGGERPKSAAWPNWRGFTKIVTTVVASAARARRMSARWPPWSQPIVGTRPIGRGARTRAARSSARVRRTRVTRSEVAVERDPARRRARGPVLLAAAERLGQDGIVHAHRFRLAGEGARGHVRRPGPDRSVDRLAQVGVEAGVARDVVQAQPEHVGNDLDLARAAGSGADADGRDAQTLGDGSGELLRYELQHDGEGARLLDCQRVGEEGARGIARLALHVHLPDLADGLRGEPDVAHDP